MCACWSLELRWGGTEGEGENLEANSLLSARAIAELELRLKPWTLRSLPDPKSIVRHLTD